MSSPRYPAYKESAVQWLGEVPAHWSLKRLRVVADLNPSKAEISGLDRDTQVSFLPMEAIGDDGSLNLERVRPIREVEAGYTYFREGDVTLAKITPCFENGKGALMRGLHGGVGFGTTELIVIRARASQTSGEYLDWLFRSPGFRLEAEASMYGAGGQKRVSDEFVRDLVWAFPAIAEQRAITSFLDRETAKIDVLIAEQKKLLALLAEKRQVTISHAVTRGLNPDAQMKDSGTSWLGEVPAHWEVRRVKDVAKLESGHTPSKKVEEYWVDCDIPWVSLNDSKQLAVSDYISETAVKINAAGLANSSARLLPAGTVVFTRDATIGLAAITTTQMAVSQHLIAWCPTSSLDALYLLRVFNAMRTHLDSLTAGATIKTIGMDDIRQLVMPVPPIGEQQQISRWISDEIQKLDSAAEGVDRSIDLLKERRSALIAAAVTGKIDVRGLVAEREAA